MLVCFYLDAYKSEDYNCFHSYTVDNDFPVVPIVGDLIDFSDDGPFDKQHKYGTETLYQVVRRTVCLGREEHDRDNTDLDTSYIRINLTKAI